MTEIPESADVVTAIRDGLIRILPPEDLAQVDLSGLDERTAMLSLPVDSAVLMALMNELEETFNVYIDEEVAFSFESVGDVSDYIRQRLTAKAHRLDGP
ncbi:MAG TPA: phosphopantetheine-binding protein [Mycobacterium sp.]|nr:phosphopantetheine-binding protein [Mycobacterium sp.]